MSERWTNPEEIISVPVWLRDRPGHQQEAAVRPMGERRERNSELDEAPLPKPLAEAGPSKRVYLKQSDFDAHGLTQGCSRKAYERKVPQRCAAHEWKNCFKEQRNQAPVRRQTSKSRELQQCKSREFQQCQVSATPLKGVMLQVPAMSLQGSVAQDAGNVVAGGVAAQDTVMSGGADGVEPVPVRKTMTRSERNDSAP